MTNNIFNLYESVKGWQLASARIKRYVDKCIADGMKDPEAILEKTDTNCLMKERNYGAADTDSRECVWFYAKQQLKLV